VSLTFSYISAQIPSFMCPEAVSLYDFSAESSKVPIWRIEERRKRKENHAKSQGVVLAIMRWVSHRGGAPQRRVWAQGEPGTDV